MFDASWTAGGKGILLAETWKTIQWWRVSSSSETSMMTLGRYPTVDYEFHQSTFQKTEALRIELEK